MHLDAHTLDDYLDEWLRGLSPAAKKELLALVRACGGDESALSRIVTKTEPPQAPRKPPEGSS